MASKKIIRLFIDTNIYLQFFSYTNDTISELHKLVALIQDKQIKLYLTDQVCDEFERNREARITDALKKMDALNVPGAPRLFEHYDEMQEYQDFSRKIKDLKNRLSQKAREEALNRSLPADKLFEDIKSAAGIIVASDDAMEDARERMERGNPPGKSGSAGDCINWSILLRKVPQDADLLIVSADEDYASQIDKKKIHPFLGNEWKRCGGNVTLYTELGQLFRDKFPKIKSPSDIQKRRAIAALVQSGSFERTHQAIEELEKYIEVLTPADIDEIVTAAQSNGQIRRIAQDIDVKFFYMRILQDRLESYSPERKDQLERLFEIGAHKDEEYFPF